MKKILVLIMGLVMSMSVLAAKIGVVNTQKVFMGYSKTKTVEKKLLSEKKKLEAQLATKAKNLKKAADELNAKGDKVTTAEKDKFQKQQVAFAKERQTLQQKLGTLEQKEMGAIQSKISSAVKQVAAKGKYDLVVDSNAVLYGGEDITSEVLKTLESLKSLN